MAFSAIEGDFDGPLPFARHLKARQVKPMMPLRALNNPEPGESGMPFKDKRGDAREAIAPAAAVDPDDARLIGNLPIVLTPDEYLAQASGGEGDAAPDGAFIAAGLRIAMALAGFSPAQTNDANDALARFAVQACKAAERGADGAVTLRFEANRDGSRRVRIGVTVGGRPIAEPAVFEAVKAEG